MGEADWFPALPANSSPRERRPSSLVQTAEELAATVEDERPLVGLFGESTLPFVLDGRERAPDLPTMVHAALDRLEDDPRAFCSWSKPRGSTTPRT